MALLGDNMKFKDPYSIVCSTCGIGSKLPVKELLARQARCPSCGQLLTDVSDRMYAALDMWSDYVAAIVLTIQIEEQYPGVFDMTMPSSKLSIPYKTSLPRLKPR